MLIMNMNEQPQTLTNQNKNIADLARVQILCFQGGLVFGIVNLVGNFGTVFCDQAYWQSSVAAKPLQVK